MERIELFPSTRARFRGELSASDPGIPPELKDFASEAGDRTLVLARVGDILWIACESSFKRIDLTQGRKVRLVSRTPARGPGFISIMTADKAGKGCSVIVDYDRHTDELFDEAKVLAEKIGDFLGYTIESAFGGADC